MTGSQQASAIPGPGESGASADVAELELSLSRLAYLVTRARRNEMITPAAQVPLDRAAVVVLRQLSAAGAMRPGELADALDVEAPHITRQLQKLADAGYVQRTSDPVDNRAQLVELTSSGEAACGRVAARARQGIGDALAHWLPSDLHQLATLLHRMLDDFVVHSGADAPAKSPRATGPLVGEQETS